MGKEAQRRARTRQARHWPATTLAGPTGNANPRMGKRASVPKGGGMFLSAAPTLLCANFWHMRSRRSSFPFTKSQNKKAARRLSLRMAGWTLGHTLFRLDWLAECCDVLLLRCQPRPACFVELLRIASHRIAAHSHFRGDSPIDSGGNSSSNK